MDIKDSVNLRKKTLATICQIHQFFIPAMFSTIRTISLLKHIYIMIVVNVK